MIIFTEYERLRKPDWPFILIPGQYEAGQVEEFKSVPILLFLHSLNLF